MRLNKSVGKITKLNDIKFKGLLSYRHVRIIGWAMMVVTQISIVLASMAKNWAGTAHNVDAIATASDITAVLGSLALPLFLLANFAIIFNSRENILQVIKKHALFALLIYLIFLLIYERYICGLLVTDSFKKESVDAMIGALFSTRLNFNIFIDLLLCSITYFFVIYNPKKHFQGKKIIIFRFMTILPIGYEIASLILKGLSIGMGLFVLPVEVLPLLTSKPTMTFCAFLAILFFMKRRETLYKKRVGSLDGFQEFLETNTNSFHFSAFASIAFLIAGIADIVLNIVLYNLNSQLNLNELNAFLKAWGTGNASGLIFIAPVALFFRYTKTHDEKTKYWDILIPIIGISLCILATIEGYFDLIKFK